MAGSINSVVIVGNLTRDPELRATPSGTSVCSLRIAVNDRVKDQTTGEWGDKANYFDVDVFGGQGETLRAVPRPRAPGGRQRPAALARVGDAGRPEASGRQHRWPTTSSSSARAKAAAVAAARAATSSSPPPAAVAGAEFHAARPPARPPTATSPTDDDIPF